MRTRWLVGGVLACAIAWSSSAHAQDITDLPPGQGTAPATPGVEQRRQFWESGTARPFVAATFDLGAVYFRPTMHLGYGKPHLRWTGIEFYPAVSSSGVSGYAGAFGVLPPLELRVGAKFNRSINQHYLERRDSYTLDQTELEVGARAAYLTYEADASFSPSVPWGSAFIAFMANYVTGVPDGLNVWHDSLRVVVEPPWAFRTRGGTSFNVDRYDTMQIGVVGDVLHVPERDLWSARVGPTFSVALTHHLQAIGAALFVVAQRDQTGLRGADFGQVGLRYKWATGDRWPEFP